jgi:hypothetical protein
VASFSGGVVDLTAGAERPASEEREVKKSGPRGEDREFYLLTHPSQISQLSLRHLLSFALMPYENLSLILPRSTVSASQSEISQ